MKTHYIAFWNLENLFDILDAPARPQWLRDKLAKELAGWDSAVLDRKIKQLATIICGMNDGKGPDLLGVCEVENRPVLKKLVAALASLGRNYAIAHHDMSDERGIDIAFIYDTAEFTAQEQFSHVVMKRNATRDLFQVNFRTAAGKELIAIGNHWPSRSGGTLESEPYRMTAGETLGYWLERIVAKKGDHTAVVVMGDFNDEPFSRSITDYALAGNSAAKVLHAKSPRLYNLMWPLMGEGLGTHYFDNFACIFDQFWVSKGIAGGQSGFSVEKQAARIEMAAPMVSPGAYPGPIRFGRPADGLNLDGFSDHYPITLLLREKS